jgi:hypothetical protein
MGWNRMDETVDGSSTNGSQRRNIKGHGAAKRP